MGMFDYVQCDARLPVKRDAFVRCHNNPFQSKSVRLWETKEFGQGAYENGCVTITIGNDNILYGPDSRLLDWSGRLRFYAGGNLPDFIATCDSGRVVKIETEQT